MPNLWDGYEGAQPVPAEPNLWPGDRAPVRFTVRPPPPPQLWDGLTGAVGKQVPPSFALPPEVEQPGIVERSLPKVYDPLQQQQQEVFKHAFSLTPMGSITDAYDAIQQSDPAGLTMAAAGMLPIPGARAAAKAAKAAKVGEEVVQGFAPYANPRLRAQAEALRGKYPQYAEEYPAVGPPELMWNLPDPDKPGKFLKTAGGTVPYKTLEEAIAKAKEPGFFLEKKLTPEAEQFQKDRNIIQRDMDLHGYDPYFDPAKRFDVDPKHYGPFEDTAVTASPKTQVKRDEWDAKYGTDEIRARLQEGFKRGSQVPESDRWYLMGQLEQAYIKQLGPKAGREAFEKEFADMMAATTGGAAPYDNNLMAHYANFINKRGERLPEAGWQLPFPIGGRFASGNLKQAQKYIDDGNVDWAENNAKRYDFSSAFKGNKNAGTIDEQMMTAYDPSLTDKQPKWYGPATKTLREEAAKAGVDARGFQDVDWAGLKALKTEAKGKEFEYEGPMINQQNRSIETTHRLTGMPREEIVRRGTILKEIPMYTVAGAVGTGAALAPGLFGGDEAQAGPLNAVRKGIKAALPMDETARMARAKEMGLTNDVYHATKNQYDEFRDPNSIGDWTSTDRALGTHFAKDPEISNSFVVGRDDRYASGKAAVEGGRVIPARIPPDEKMLQVPQPRYEHALSNTPDWRAVKTDQSAVENLVAGIAYRKRPDLLSEYLQDVRGLKGGEASRAAKKLASGGTYKIDDREYTLDKLLDSFGGAPHDRDTHRQVVETGRKALQEQGYEGLRYINTAPQEMANAKDPTSYIVFDPARARSRFAAFDPAQKDSRNLVAGLAGLLGTGAAATLPNMWGPTPKEARQ